MRANPNQKEKWERDINKGVNLPFKNLRIEEGTRHRDSARGL